MTTEKDELTGKLSAATSRPLSSRTSSTKRLVRLCVKELREILRDRRTIVTLVFMPLLVYPLLSMAFQKFALSSLSSLSQVECLVGVESEQSVLRLTRFLQTGEAILRSPGAAGTEPNASPTRAQLSLDAEPKIRWLYGDELRKGVASGAIDVGVVLLEGEELEQSTGFRRQLNCQVIYREESALSKVAADYITKRLDAINKSYTKDILHVRLPTDFQLDPVSGSGGAAAFSLTTLVPLILILMTITGAVYPAIDLTAGERERGTLETLMAAPVPRLGLLIAKYVAVLTVALFTATANLVAMTVTLVATGLGETVFGAGGLTANLVAQVFALLILFAAFFSAMLLAVTSFARSFKEAQAYLIPLMLLSLAPGMMSLMPDLEFNGLLAVTPLVNIVLLARDIFEGDVQPTLATAAVLSTALYAFAAIGLAARIFGTDAILYGSQATWADLMRRSEQRRDAATLPGAMFCLAALFPIYFLLGNFLHRLPGASIGVRLAASAVVTALLFVGVPIVAAIFQRVRFVTGFQLRFASIVAFLGAVALGVSAWPFAHEVFLFNEMIGLGGIDPAKLESVKSLLNAWRDLSPVVILLTLAITPAVCEEFYFRGYLMGALQKSTQPAIAIVVSAILFGAFHVIATSALSTERFLPSTLMGLILGWVCYKTRSVLPGMLLHATHNGLLLMVAYYQDELKSRGWGVAEQSHLPALWLASAAVGLAIGVGLVILSTRPPPPVNVDPIEP
ncbi:MAG: ABC transporter permease subunit [Planctomycetaceae bacterium]|nr:ABC transporter permease subunit [Planctomycetales bacterium]MCB9941601.1 ABC transporter permease subunit [Planctomycetaceae bacterium]